MSRCLRRASSSASRISQRHPHATTHRTEAGSRIRNPPQFGQDIRGLDDNLRLAPRRLAIAKSKSRAKLPTAVKVRRRLNEAWQLALRRPPPPPRLGVGKSARGALPISASRWEQLRVEDEQAIQDACRQDRAERLFLAGTATTIPAQRQPAASKAGKAPRHCPHRRVNFCAACSRPDGSRRVRVHVRDRALGRARVTIGESAVGKPPRLVSGALPLYESWAPPARGCILLPDSKATLEEIRAGVDSALRARSRAWLRARRRFGSVIPAPARLLELRRRRPILVLDPLAPLATLRHQIARLLTAWNTARSTKPPRFRRAQARAIRAMAVLEHEHPSTEALAKLLRCSVPKARRAKRYAVKLLSRKAATPATIGAEIERCNQCKPSILCETHSKEATRFYQLPAAPERWRATGRTQLSVEQAEEIAVRREFGRVGRRRPSQ